MTERGRPKPPVKAQRRISRGLDNLPPAESASQRTSHDTKGATKAVAADCLLRALTAPDLLEKRLFCQLGLGADDSDDEIRGLLLRQMYLVELEQENDEAALLIAEEMVDLETLGDVARQDAARAAVALGRLDVAIGHLRIAARICPAARRSFHYAHLGVLLRFSGRKKQALEALEKAKRWATSDRALYLAIYALAEADADGTETDWIELRTRLTNAPSTKAYGLWVLGELSLRAGDPDAAQMYLRRFLERMTDAPRAKSLSLKGEIEHARQLLKQIWA